MEWFGELPKRWDIKRIGVLFAENIQTNSNLVSELPMQFKFGEIVQKKQTEKDSTFLESIKRYTLVSPNDIMVNGLNLNYDFITQRVAIVKESGCITPAYISLRAKNQIKPEYACYLLKTMDAQKLLNGLGTGIRLTLSYSELKKTFLPLPPREEQDRIVRYLDWKVSQINKLINAKKKQITLLQEQKQAVINRAVTKGLDPDAEMKDSGTEWLDKVPKTWSRLPAKALFKQSKETAYPEDDLLAASQRYGIIPQSEYMMLEGRRIVLATGDLDKWKHVEPGYFIISLRSFQGGLELCKIKGSVTWHYIVLLPTQSICSAFYKWLFKSKSYISALQRTSDYIRDGQDLRYSNFVKVDLFNVPMNEQIAISDYLDKVIPKIDAAINRIDREMQLINEYRTRLISDVVTGKLDVRNVAIPDYEAVEEMADIIDDISEEVEVGDDS